MDSLGQFRKQRLNDGPVEAKLPCLVEIAPGAIILAFAPVGHSPACVGVGKVGVEPEGLIEVLKGAVEMAFVPIGYSPVRVGVGKVGLEVEA